MKIGIDVSQMCYEGTGVARYVFGLVNALLNLDTPHEFILYAGAFRQKAFFDQLKKNSPWDKAKWIILPIPPKVSGLVFNTFSLPMSSLIGPVDVFHSSDWASFKTVGVPVTTIHDLVFIKYPATLDKLILNTQVKRLSKIVKTKSHIIADSKSTKNDLVATYGIQSDLIDVIYPGIYESYTPQSSTEIERVKTKYNLPDKYILSVGTKEPRKNLPRLVEACHTLSLPLVLTGKYGWGTPLTTPGVISTGFVSDTDLPALYSSAAVFAYPSLYEGFGFPVLEAMACGTPVVTSNVSSLPEVVEDAAVLVDPQSVESIMAGIATALENRAIYIERGFKQAKLFTWDSTAKKTLEVYEKIANRH